MIWENELELYVLRMWEVRGVLSFNVFIWRDLLKSRKTPASTLDNTAEILIVYSPNGGIQCYSITLLHSYTNVLCVYKIFIIKMILRWT
jgi:hypothetical protein